MNKQNLFREGSHASAHSHAHLHALLTTDLRAHESRPAPSRHDRHGLSLRHARLPPTTASPATKGDKFQGFHVFFFTFRSQTRHTAQCRNPSRQEVSSGGRHEARTKTLHTKRKYEHLNTIEAGRK
ncbi:hypothetical protein E2C01_016180 [Portunus trituberculatus]|uniref:Uncharacterized protein n=1 Tax=Portunus trituberculatus TaxID=210409 RepID=A0A5B7DND7_PORTR|nr:hypothetical protein [Portunus trituberculatus]